MLVYCCCCNKLLQSQQLKTTPGYHLTVLWSQVQLGSPWAKISVYGSVFLSRASGEEFIFLFVYSLVDQIQLLAIQYSDPWFLASYQLRDVPSFQKPFTLLGLWPSCSIFRATHGRLRSSHPPDFSYLFFNFSLLNLLLG